MAKGCYTCRRRRITCDNGLPTCRKCRDAGKECLGYQKPLVWVKGGVASRGKMMGRSFDDIKPDSEPSSPDPPANTSRQIPGKTEDDSYEHAPELSSEVVQYGSKSLIQADYMPTPWGLVDPLLKDLTPLSRMYILHFNQYLVEDLMLYPKIRNPYRDLSTLASDSPVLAHALSAIGALHYSLMANDGFSPDPWSSNNISPTGELLFPGDIEEVATSLMHRRPTTKVYGDFLGFKQRALQQVSRDICNPNVRNDRRTLAAIMILALMDAIESGDGAWKYHLEGAKKLFKSREDGPKSRQEQGIIDWLDTLTLDGCLIIQLMGSTLARPGTLSKPFYTSAMGPAVLKRLEKTSWVGCPAYLLEVIFFIHAGLCLDESTAETEPTFQPTLMFSSTFLPENSNPFQSPTALLQHIKAFDPVQWAESMQSSQYLTDLTLRIALAKVYKAAVYLYTSRVISRPRPGLAPISTTFGLPTDHKYVARTLIDQIALIPVKDPHFKCLIWPTFIAGAECRDPSQRPFILDRMSTLYTAFASNNLRNAAWVVSLMWQKQDSRAARRLQPTQNGRDEVYETIDDDNDHDFDWVQELDDSRVDWLFI